MDKALVKALKLLETLVRSDESRGVTDLANELGITKSNVHRLLQTFSNQGLVHKSSDTDRYSCTLKLWEWGELVSDRIAIKDVARPYLVALSNKTRETVHLSILEGCDVVYIDKIDSQQIVGTYAQIASRRSAIGSATGKAMLAFRSDNELKAVCAMSRELTEESIDEPALAEELAQVRNNGYAVFPGDEETGACGLAAPVIDASRKVNSAIGISGPISRIKPRLVEEFSPIVMAVAHDLSRALGYSGEYFLAPAAGKRTNL